MIDRFLKTLPEIAGDPLAIMAYLLVLGAWLIWALKRINAKTFIKAMELVPEHLRSDLAGNSGYNYDDLSNLTSEQRVALLSKRYRLAGYLATLVLVIVMVALVITH